MKRRDKREKSVIFRKKAVFPPFLFAKYIVLRYNIDRRNCIFFQDSLRDMLFIIRIKGCQVHNIGHKNIQSNG